MATFPNENESLVDKGKNLAEQSEAAAEMVAQTMGFKGHNFFNSDQNRDKICAQAKETAATIREISSAFQNQNEAKVTNVSRLGYGSSSGPNDDGNDTFKK